MGVILSSDLRYTKQPRRLVWGYFRGLRRVLVMFCPLFSLCSNRLVLYCIPLDTVVLDCSLLGRGCTVGNYWIPLKGLLQIRDRLYINVS